MKGGYLYQPITPATCKLLEKRWDRSRYEAHRQYVGQARCVIDNKPPRTHMHLHCKLKKLQLEEERLAIVQRDNRVLMEKISHIMRTDGSLDNRNDYEPKSLNQTKRQRELLRMTHENHAILKRLMAKEPTYHHWRFLEEWNVNQQYMGNISKYPHSWRSLSQRPVKKYING